MCARCQQRAAHQPLPSQGRDLAVAGAGLVTAYVEPLKVGEALPDRPLFLAPEHYINVLLERTYYAAWEGVPDRWRRVMEAGGLMPSRLC